MSFLNLLNFSQLWYYFWDYELTWDLADFYEVWLLTDFASSALSAWFFEVTEGALP